MWPQRDLEWRGKYFYSKTLSPEGSYDPLTNNKNHHLHLFGAVLHNKNDGIVFSLYLISTLCSHIGFRYAGARTTVWYSQFPCCLAILLDIYKKVNLFPLRPSHLITSSMQCIVSRNSSITGICVCVTGLIVNRKEKRSPLLLLLLLPVVDTTWFFRYLVSMYV